MSDGPPFVTKALHWLGIGSSSDGDAVPIGVVGTGTDLVEVGRFREALTRTPGMKQRCFTDDERAYAEQRTDPVERYAARFAAKEAVLKALGVGLGACELRDIEVVRADSGQPSVRLHGAAAELAADRGVTDWHLSLTHTERSAQATVVAEARR